MEADVKKEFNYKQAEARKKKFLRYKEGSEIYSMGITKFQEIAKLAGAVYKINCECQRKSLPLADEFVYHLAG